MQLYPLGATKATLNVSNKIANSKKINRPIDFLKLKLIKRSIALILIFSFRLDFI